MYFGDNLINFNDDLINYQLGLDWICPHCGSYNPAGTIICMTCGLEFGGVNQLSTDPKLKFGACV